MSRFKVTRSQIAAFARDGFILVRQLYDFKHGTRAGSGSLLMQPVVERLEIEDMISIAAYAASLPP